MEETAHISSFHVFTTWTAMLRCDQHFNLFPKTFDLNSPMECSGINVVWKWKSARRNGIISCNVVIFFSIFQVKSVPLTSIILMKIQSQVLQQATSVTVKQKKSHASNITPLT